MEIGSNFSEKAKRDYRLVELAKSGDQKAYAELLGYYRDSLYFMLLKMVKNKDDAEDLTIEAFGKAFNNIESYSSNYAFSTWLFKIATNNGIDFLRSRKSQRNIISIDRTDSDSDGSLGNKFSLVENEPNPEEKMIAGQKEKLLRTILKKLHPDYRRILTLRYFDEFSYLEIADELNIPIGTVKARLFRSRELFISILKKHQIDSGNG
jgi:RNA polymerase sigma-70 factor (ECF subfamily)